MMNRPSLSLNKPSGLAVITDQSPEPTSTLRAAPAEVSISAINRHKKQVYVRTSQQTFEQASSQELIQGKKGMLASAAAAANTAPVTDPTNPAPDSPLEQPETSVKPMAQDKAKLSLNFQTSTETKEDSEAANVPFVPKLRPMLFVQDYKINNDNKTDNTSLAVEENIWGDYIFRDLTGARMVLEFLTIYAGRYIQLSPSNSDLPPQASNQLPWCSAEEQKDLAKTKIYRPINEFLRRMLFNNVLEQKQFTHPYNKDIWGCWWKEFTHQNPDPTYADSYLPKMLENLYVNQEPELGNITEHDAKKVRAFNKFREHIGFLRALTFDIDTDQRFTSLYLFPFGAEALYFDAACRNNSFSIDTRFFKGSGQILFAMLQRTLLAEDETGHQAAVKALGQIKDNLERKFINIAPSSHFASINKLVRLLSISPRMLEQNVNVPPNVNADGKLEEFLQNQLNSLTKEFVLGCDECVTKDSTIKFLPSKNTELELFTNLAQDIAVILSLDITEIEIFDHLCCIMGLYLLRYTALRAQQVFVEAETLITLTDRIANRCEKDHSSAADALYKELEQHSLDEIAQNVSKPKYPYFVVESLIKGNDNTSQIRQYSIRLYREHFSIMLKECSERYVDYRVRYALLSMILAQKQPTDTPHGAEQTEGNNWGAGLSWQEIIGKENFGLFLKNGLDYYLLKEFPNKSLAKHNPNFFWDELMQELDSSDKQSLDKFIGALQNKVTTRKGNEDYRCLTTLGKSIGLVSSEGSRGLRFILSDKMLKALVVTTLNCKNGQKYMRDQDFFQQLFERFGVIIDTKQFEAMQRQCAAKGSAQSAALGDNVDFKPNTANFIQRLVSLNLCEKLPDSSITYIKNPYCS